MNGYIVEIDELQDDLVVLVVPTLRLLVFGRTMGEALTRARASTGGQLLDSGALDAERAEAGSPARSSAA